MSCSSETSVVRGSREYLYADIRTDRVLDAQAVVMSVSSTAAPSTWQSAEWTGSPGKFRSARILLDGTLPAGRYYVYARITDNPEAPIIEVGRLTVK
jgi:hypothetical protein